MTSFFESLRRDHPAYPAPGRPPSRFHGKDEIEQIAWQKYLAHLADTLTTLDTIIDQRNPHSNGK